MEVRIRRVGFVDLSNSLNFITPDQERVALASFHLGPTQFQDFFGELIKLQPVGSISDYQTQFEKLLSRQVNCFVSGLKDTLEAYVLAGHPRTLASTIELAWLYESRNISQRHTTNIPEVKKSFPTKREFTSSNSNLQIRRLAPARIQERRAKGLCYNCNEKFVLGHRYKKLFLIEACYEEEDEDVVMDDERAILKD